MSIFSIFGKTYLKSYPSFGAEQKYIWSDLNFNESSDCGKTFGQKTGKKNFKGKKVGTISSNDNIGSEERGGCGRGIDTYERVYI